MKQILKCSLVLLVTLSLVLLAAMPLLARGGKPEEKGAVEIKKPVDMTILGIGGWLPSRLGVDMSPLFAEYAKEKYGYEASFSFQEAPFSALFQKAAASLATKSQEYNLIISDSQWLGAFAEPGWIVNINGLIEENPELDIEWYDPVVKNTYMVYPDGTDQLWGFPEEGDVIVLFVRKDLFGDPQERRNFKSQYGFELPQNFEDWEDVRMTQFEEMAKFFTRPDKDLYGTAMQYQKEYDFMTMYLYPFMFSLGGEIWDPQDRRIYGILNSEVNAQAMRWNKRMLNYQPPGAINYGIPEEIDAFTQGKVATAFQWAAVGAAMITDKNRDDVIVVPPPAFKREDGSVRRIYSVGGQPWVINAFNDKEHMRVAVDFLKWWYLPETQMEYARRGGNPTDKATLTSPGFEDIQPWFRAYKYMLTTDRARDFWHEPKYSEMLAVQQEGWTAFAAGQVTDALNTLDWIACQQQKIMYEADRSDIAPPAECQKITLGK